MRVSSDGTLYGARRGNAYITIRTYNGLSATIRVYVCKSPTGVSISPTSTVLGVGDEIQFKASVTSGSAGTVTFVSSDPNILEVDGATGKAVAKSGGEVIVAAQTYNGYRAWSRVTIYAAPEWISTDFASLSMGAGEKKKISVTFSEGSYSQLRYSSSDPTVATVSADGTITAVSRGTTTILVETSVESVFAQIAVEVWNAPTWAKLDATKTLNVDETMKLSPEIDENARTSWTFASSNTSVATVNANGEVTALNRGQTTLTARAYNGVTAQMVLTVYDPWYPESVEITNAVEILNVGDTWSIETAVTPETAVPKLKWTSSNTNVATIDENGKSRPCPADSPTSPAYPKRMPPARQPSCCA